MQDGNLLLDSFVNGTSARHILDLLTFTSEDARSQLHFYLDNSNSQTYKVTAFDGETATFTPATGTGAPRSLRVVDATKPTAAGKCFLAAFEAGDELDRTCSYDTYINSYRELQQHDAVVGDRRGAIFDESRSLLLDNDKGTAFDVSSATCAAEPSHCFRGRHSRLSKSRDMHFVAADNTPVYVDLAPGDTAGVLLEAQQERDWWRKAGYTDVWNEMTGTTDSALEWATRCCLNSDPFYTDSIDGNTLCGARSLHTSIQAGTLKNYDVAYAVGSKACDTLMTTVCAQPGHEDDERCACINGEPGGLQKLVYSELVKLGGLQKELAERQRHCFISSCADTAYRRAADRGPCKDVCAAFMKLPDAPQPGEPYRSINVKGNKMTLTCANGVFARKQGDEGVLCSRGSECMSGKCDKTTLVKVGGDKLGTCAAECTVDEQCDRGFKCYASKCVIDSGSGNHDDLVCSSTVSCAQPGAQCYKEKPADQEGVCVLRGCTLDEDCRNFHQFKMCHDTGFCGLPECVLDSDCSRPPGTLLDMQCNASTFKCEVDDSKPCKNVVCPDLRTIEYRETSEGGLLPVMATKKQRCTVRQGLNNRKFSVCEVQCTTDLDCRSQFCNTKTNTCSTKPRSAAACARALQCDSRFEECACEYDETLEKCVLCTRNPVANSLVDHASERIQSVSTTAIRVATYTGIAVAVMFSLYILYVAFRK